MALCLVGAGWLSPLRRIDHEVRRSEVHLLEVRPTEVRSVEVRCDEVRPRFDRVAVDFHGSHAMPRPAGQPEGPSIYRWGFGGCIRTFCHTLTVSNLL